MTHRFTSEKRSGVEVFRTGHPFISHFARVVFCLGMLAGAATFSAQPALPPANSAGPWPTLQLDGQGVVGLPPDLTGCGDGDRAVRERMAGSPGKAG